MRNRQRFWIGAAIAAVMLAGCMAMPPRPPVMQQAPNLSHSLAPNNPASGVISPYDGTVPNAGDEEAIKYQKIVKVGLLLPISGRNAQLAKALQDAAAVSLFDKYARLPISQQTIRVELLPKDTGDTPQQAATAITAAIGEGAQFIIGPLFADAAAVAAPIAQAHNISMLSFSNTRSQASPGSYMFGFSPVEQTDRIITYALNNGLNRIVVLAPNSALGETVLTAARTAMQRQEKKLVREAKYSVQGTGVETALNQLIAPGKEPEFDAILIPEGGPALTTVMRGLSARGVKPSTVKFLGTGLWDDAELLRRVNLDNAWFASSPPELTSQFETRFRTTYGYAPPRIASLAYDAVALSVTLATSGRNFDAVTLTSPGGFSGPANGVFRLRASGETQRGLAVMEVKNGTPTVISPAPSGF